MRVKHAKGAPSPFVHGCAAIFGAPCMLRDTMHTACVIMGPSRGWSERMITEAMNAQLSHRFSTEQRAAIRDRMARWGEPLYHAVARVTGNRCHCAPCSNPSDPRHPWMIEDPS